MIKTKQPKFAVLTLLYILISIVYGCGNIKTITLGSNYQKKVQGQSTLSIVDSLGLTLTKGAFGNIINGQNFQQDALISYMGWQYITYYNSSRNVCVGRRKLPDGLWEIVRLTDYHFSYIPKQDNDAHNTISMGICKNDGTLHLAFDHHGSPLHYRISQKEIINRPEAVKWDASLFSPVQDYLEEGKPLSAVTYPCFVSTPQGDLILGYRIGGSRNAGYFLSMYDGDWKDTHQVMSGVGIYKDLFKGDSKTRNGYINGLHYGKDGKLHLSWTWREAVSGVGNRDIAYAYSSDNGKTWYNTFGVVVATFDEKKLIDTYSPDIVIKKLDRHFGIMNSQAQAVDHNGIVHTVMYRRKESNPIEDWARISNGAVYFHNYRKPDGTWEENQTPFIGNRPKLLVDKNNNLYIVYVKKDQFDSKFETAPLIVIKGTASCEWTNWKEIFVSEEKYFNEAQVDLQRWVDEGIISVMVQDGPAFEGAESPVKVLDIRLK